MTRRFRFVALVLMAVLSAVAVAACGSSDSPPSASSLLKDTFGSGHSVKSGKLSASLVFAGTGLKTLQGPLALNVSGPFESQGKGQVPKVDLTLTLNAAGSGTTIGVVSTGDKGYVRLQKQAFVLDDATYNKLKQNYAQSASKSTGAGPSLSSLGVDPLRWLSNPTVAGSTETVGGAETWHVTADVDVNAFTADLSTLLSKASSLSSTTKLPSSLSTVQRLAIVSSIKSAKFDVWTGKDDKTLRRVRLTVDISVPPAIQSRAGGLKTGKLGVDLTIADLNKSQDISAPANAQPLSSLSSLLGAATGSTGSTGSGSAPAPTTTTPGTTGSTATPGAGASSKYLDCVAKAEAKNDVAALQRCKTLIGQ